MPTRTDVHSPTNLVTEDYDFLGCGDFGGYDEPGYSPLMTPYAQQLLKEGWKFADVETAGCQHCGARLRYYAVLLHNPSKSFLRVGETCLDNRFSLATKEFQSLRKAAKLNRERRVQAEVRAEFRRDHADVIDFLTKKVEEATEKFGYTPDPEYDDCGYLGFYLSIEQKLMRYGTLSERQVEAVRKGIVKSAEFEARKAAEAKTATPVIEGRIVITGEVVSLKEVDSNYGTTTKMVVKDDRGFRVYGTVPASIDSIDGEFLRKGHRVTFTATVKASEKDPTFGFYSRPTKASAA